MDRDVRLSGLTLQRPRDAREYREDQAVKGHQMAPVDRSLIRQYEIIDRRSLRAYRLDRIRAQLRLRDYGGILLADPLNIRYATDTNNLGLWVMHSPSRYVYIATDGPVILFDFVSSRHNSEGIETIDEIRPAIPWLYFLSQAPGSKKRQRCGLGKLPIWFSSMVRVIAGLRLIAVILGAQSA